MSLGKRRQPIGAAHASVRKEWKHVDRKSHDKREDSPAVRKLREHMSRVKA